MMMDIRWWSAPLELFDLDSDRYVAWESTSHGVILGASLGALGWLLIFWLNFD